MIKRPAHEIVKQECVISPTLCFALIKAFYAAQKKEFYVQEYLMRTNPLKMADLLTFAKDKETINRKLPFLYHVSVFG